MKKIGEDLGELWLTEVLGVNAKRFVWTHRVKIFANNSKAFAFLSKTLGELWRKGLEDKELSTESDLILNLMLKVVTFGRS